MYVPGFRFEGSSSNERSLYGVLRDFTGLTGGGVGEIDPIFIVSPSYSITSLDISNWNTAFANIFSDAPSDGNLYGRLNATWSVVGSDIDGGFANSVYLVSQLYDGGSA